MDMNRVYGTDDYVRFMAVVPYSDRLCHSLTSGHWGFVEDGQRIYVLNIPPETVMKYAAKENIRSDWAYLDIENEGVAYFRLKDSDLAYNGKYNPFIQADSGEPVPDITDILSKANSVIARNIREICRDLPGIYTDAIEFGMNRTGIAPWYLRQKLYKGLNG